MKSFLTQIDEKLRGYIPKTRNYNSIEWYKGKIKDLIKTKKKLDKSLLKEPFIGKMFLMMYDPKTKENLKYYDVFPLIFIVRFTRNGFLGINLHYLPVQERMALLKALYSIGTNNSKMDETTRLLLSYRVINEFSKRNHAKVCLKRYLYRNIHYINLVFPEQWINVVSLPLERFMKESRNVVWKDSLKKL